MLTVSVILLGLGAASLLLLIGFFGWGLCAMFGFGESGESVEDYFGDEWEDQGKRR